MSIEMFVEVDDQLAIDELAHVFNELGVHNFTNEEHGFSGRFPASEMQFHVFQEGKAALGSQVVSEGIDDVGGWTIHTRIKFTYVNANFDECSSEIKEFVDRLASRTRAKFVLSFQFEKIYAIRDGAGLRYLEAF